MATTYQMLERLDEALYRLPSEVEKIADQLSEKIIDLNRMQQLFEGKNTEGQIIGYYSKATEEAFGGREKGKIAGEPYNFEDTGDLFKAFEMDFEDGKLEIYSTDSKVPILKEKYEHGRGTLFGLTWEHEMEFNYELLKPEILEFLKRIILNG